MTHIAYLQQTLHGLLAGTYVVLFTRIPLARLLEYQFTMAWKINTARAMNAHGIIILGTGVEKGKFFRAKITDIQTVKEVKQHHAITPPMIEHEEIGESVRFTGGNLKKILADEHYRKIIFFTNATANETLPQNDFHFSQNPVSYVNLG